MRKLTIIALLLLVVVIGPASAFSPRESFLDNVAAIAWLDGQDLNVALGNTSNNRVNVTLSTTTLDSWGRPVFSNRQITVPARSVIVERLYPANPGRNERWTLRVSEGYRSANILVQHFDSMSINDYVVQANTNIDVTMDLDFMLDGRGNSRLSVSDYYQTADGYNQGSIRISSFEGGLRQVKSSNTIEYVRPHMVLRMKTPQVTGLTTMSFKLSRTESGYDWRDEEIQGPIIMVYGRNLRFAGAATISEDSGRIKY